MVTSGALGVFFIFVIQVLAAQRALIPGVIFEGSFILFAVWMAGLVDTSIQLFGTSGRLGNINSNCQTYVSQMESTGNSLATLAWLTQNTICKSIIARVRVLVLCPVLTLAGNCWRTSFAWELINVILYFWMMIMSYQVKKDFWY